MNAYWSAFCLISCTSVAIMAQGPPALPPAFDVQYAELGQCDGCSFQKSAIEGMVTPFGNGLPWTAERTGSCPDCGLLNFSHEGLFMFADHTMSPYGVTTFLREMPGLRVFDVSHNELIFLLQFSGAPFLEELYVNNNNLASMHGIFNSLESLQLLDLSNNMLQAVQGDEFTGLTNLKALNLSHNLLQSIAPLAFADLASLEVLNLAGNQLSEIEAAAFFGLGSLTELDLSNNAITLIDDAAFLALVSLKDLYFSPLNISILESPAFGTLPNTTRLHIFLDETEYHTLSVCDGCQFVIAQTLTTGKLSRRSSNCSAACSTLFFWAEFITEIEPSALAGLPHVTDLFIAQSPLEQVHPDQFVGLPSLRRLVLTNTRLSTLPPGAFNGLTNLTYLALDFNELQFLPPGLFSGLPNLEHLSLMGNSLSAIMPFTFAGLDSLTTLALNGNPIPTLASFGFAGLSSLQSIYLRTIPVTAVQPDAFAGLSALSALDLSGTPLAQLAPGAFRGLERVTSVDLSATAITTLAPGTFEGLQNASSLTLDELALGRLVGGVFVGAESVSELSISGSGLEQIEPGAFAGMSALRHLDLSFNALDLTWTNRTFEGLAHLDSLSLRGNWLQTVGAGWLAGLDGLLALDLSENGIESLDREGMFAEVPSLRSLTIQGVWLTWNLGFRERIASVNPLAFKGLDRLEELDLQWSALEDVSGAFAFLPALTKLQLRKNRLWAIGPDSFRGLSANVTHLGLVANRFNAIGANGFVGLPMLRALALDANWIRQEWSSSDCFAGLQNLETLSLSSNDFRWLNPFWFKDLTGLKSLNLASMGIHGIAEHAWAGLESLQTLDVRDNHIGWVPTFSAATPGEMVLTSIRPFTFEHLSSVQTLLFQGNSFSKIDSYAFSGLTSMTELNLCDSQPGRLRDPDAVLRQVETMAFAGMAKLERLQLCNGALTTIEPQTFYGLPSLKHLDMGRNRLTSINESTFRDLPTLEELNLQENNIRTVHAKALSGMMRLRSLTLTHNRISTLPEELFSGLQNLATLNLVNNTITHIEPGTLVNLQSLDDLQLVHNALACRPMLPSTFAINSWAVTVLWSSNVFFLPSCLPQGCHLDAGALIGSGDSSDHFGTFMTLQAVGTVLELFRSDAGYALDWEWQRQGLVVTRGRTKRCWCAAIPMCYTVSCRHCSYDNSSSVGVEQEPCQAGFAFAPPAMQPPANLSGDTFAETMADFPGALSPNGECVDVDECRTGLHDCPSVATCANTIGSFACECPAGSTDILDDNGTVACECAQGFQPGDDGTSCEDEDECEHGQDDCHLFAQCINTAGSFQCECPGVMIGNGTWCTCPAGFRVAGVETCEEVDECAEGAHTCGPTADCHNIPGSFECNYAPVVQSVLVEATIFNSADDRGTFSAEVTWQDAGDDGEHVVALDWDCDGVDDHRTMVPAARNHTNVSLSLIVSSSAVHAVCVRIRDSRGREATEMVSMVAEFEPTPNGFVAGAGWLDSRRGALWPTEVDRAWFGFVVKHGSEAPGLDGITGAGLNHSQVQGEMDFIITEREGQRVLLRVKSDHITALTISGPTEAEFWGSGVEAVSGRPVTFAVTLENDGEAESESDGETCDNVQVRLWDGETERLMYDNACGSETHSSPIRTGSVVVAEACDDGFRLTTEGLGCEDVDECEEGLHDCHEHAECHNLEGGFECECFAGFRGNGAECACVDGFRITDTDDGLACVDVDECYEAIDNCTEQADCVNLHGDYLCNFWPKIVDVVVVSNFLFNSADDRGTFSAEVTWQDAGDDGEHVVALDWDCDGVDDHRTMVPAARNHTNVSWVAAGYEAGVYPVCIVVQDSWGLETARDVAAFVTVVSAASGGLAAGGGWFASPRGALFPAEADAALFGVVARYEDTTRLSGAMALMVKERGSRDVRLRVESETLEWLVVPGPSQAKIQGAGFERVSGREVMFMVTLADRSEDPVRGGACGLEEACDAVRIKVWADDDEQEEEEAEVLYDNLYGVDDTSWEGGGVEAGSVLVASPTDDFSLALRELATVLSEQKGQAINGSQPWGVVSTAGGALVLVAVIAAVLWRRRRQAKVPEVWSSLASSPSRRELLDSELRRTTLTASVSTPAGDEMATRAASGFGFEGGGAMWQRDTEEADSEQRAAAQVIRMAPGLAGMRGGSWKEGGADGRWRSRGPFVEGSTDSMSLAQDTSGVWAPGGQARERERDD